MQFMTSSNQSIAIIDSNAVITGIDSGISSICANTFNGTNPSCVNISVKNDDSVFVAGLSVAIQQGIEVTTFEAFESDFIYNVTFELDSKIQNVSQIIVSLQYTDNETQLIPFNELNFQLDDSEIVTINSDGELYALNNGKTNLSVTWVGPGDDCEFQLTKVIPIEVVLLLPTMVAVSPSPLVIHSLTSNSDPSAALGIQTSYEIVLLLEYSNDVVIEPTEVIYNISDDTLAKMNGNIIQANSVSGLVNLTINIPSIETDEITIQFNIVSTVAAMITASPFPVFTNSGTIDMLEIARIESTLYWQQSMLGLQVTLTDGSVIQATEELDGNLFAASSDSLTLTVNTNDNILIINPLNGVESSGTVTVTSIIPQFNGIHKTIIVVSTTVQISGAFVSSLSDNTLIGYQGTHSHRINISIELEDNSSISDILSVSDEFLNIITLNETSESFEISSNGGYLVPLLNTADKQSLTVAVAEGKFIQEITFFVNLIPDVGDTDIGQEAGPPLNTVSTGDDVVVPIYFNSGNNSLAYIEISFTYDNTVLAVSGTTLGNDWANGVYHFNTDNEGLVLFTSIFSESNIVSEQLHLFNVKLTAISPLSETILYTQVLVIGYHDGDVPIISIPYDSIAGNVTVSVTGNTKRAIVEKPIRTKRETIDSSGCNSPPCDCEDVVNGDVNNDCQFDSGDVLELLNYLKLDALLLSNASSVDNSDYDVTLDGVVDVHDAYVLFKALIGYIPLINDIDITPVQSPLSNCQFNIRITLSENTRNDIVYVLLSLETEFETTNITIGELLTYHENPSGGLIKTVKKINDLNEYTATLTTPIIGDIGISVIAQSLDSNNQTSNVRTVQYLGPLPTLYKSDLLIDTGSLFISSSNGYSPLMISYNEIMSDQCSNIPQINPELIDIVFHSPYNATVVWELDNLREGLNLSSLVFVTITECAVDQSREIILQTCQDIDPVQADTNYTALLMTQPFTFYSVIVVGPTTKSNETSEISPEDVPEGLDAPTVSTAILGTTGEVTFQWSLPSLPNGVILSYSLYINDKVQYSGLSLNYEYSVTIQESFLFYVEASNSVGRVQSPSTEYVPTQTTVEDFSPLGPLSLSQFIGVIIAVLTVFLILLLLVFIIPGAFRKRQSTKEKSEIDMARTFLTEIDKVEEKPHLEGGEYNITEVLAVPQGRIYEEQFSSEYQDNFWYSELSSMELSPTMAYSSTARTYDERQDDVVQPVRNENWDLQNDDTIEGEPDISDLYSSDTSRLISNQTTTKKDKGKKKKKHKMTKKEKEQELLPAGKPDVLSDGDCNEIMDKLKEFRVYSSDGNLSSISEHTSSNDRNKDYYFGAFDTIDPRRKPAVKRTNNSYQPERIHSSIDVLDDNEDWEISNEAIFDTISLLSAISNFEYLNEFNRLKTIRPKGSTTHARMQCNQHKNRYRNVLPSDDTRIILQIVPSLVEGSDYINANSITIHSCCPRYISTQGPLPDTVNDFWQMVWETGTTNIVMVTNPIENGRVKCEVYWPEDGAKIFRNTAVECVEKSFQKGYRIRTFRIANRGSTNFRLIKHIHYMNWPDFGLPTETATFLQVTDELKEEKELVLVHCSAGLGRSGVFIAVDAALRIHRAGLQVDVPKIVTILRQQRDGMIQTHEQYQFVYKTIASGLQRSIQGAHDDSTD